MTNSVITLKNGFILASEVSTVIHKTEWISVSMRNEIIYIYDKTGKEHLYKKIPINGVIDFIDDCGSTYYTYNYDLLKHELQELERKVLACYSQSK